MMPVGLRAGQPLALAPSPHSGRIAVPVLNAGGIDGDLVVHKSLVELPVIQMYAPTAWYVAANAGVSGRRVLVHDRAHRR